MVSKMIYSFYCFNFKSDFDLNMSLEEYMSYMPKRTNRGTIISKFFQCTECGSRNTRRRYTSPYIIYIGDGFSKSIKEKDE